MVKAKFKLNYRHSICVGITAAFVLCGIILFWPSLSRLIRALGDLGLSLAYYFCTLTAIPHSIVPTVTTLPDSGMTPLLPISPIDFAAKLAALGRRLIDPANLRVYFVGLGSGVSKTVTVLLIVVPIIILTVVLMRRLTATPNNNYNRETKPLQIFKRLTYPFIQLKRWIVSVTAFISEHAYYLKIWLAVWLVNLNLVTVLLELVAFLLYFSVSIDVGNVYLQVYKLAMDLSVVLLRVPIIIWITVAVILFARWRKSIALRTLRHFERVNRTAVESVGIAAMLVGTMGAKKTTILTDMALSQEIMLRDKALELLQANDLKFPRFPWLLFELDLKEAMLKHKVYNLATCKVFVIGKAKIWDAARCWPNIYGYDYNRYGLTYDNKLENVGVWDVLLSYAQLYFIYVVQSSLLFSNYSVRSDNLLVDQGNFPIWNTDFFSRDSKLIDAQSRYAHILDFDMLRLGRKLGEDKKKTALEFGAILITEVGKERGNQLDTQGLKKNDETTNQKNDLFNLSLKMIRHPGTVDYYPFVKVLMDDQRPESLGADARELCRIIRIDVAKEEKLALPCFWLEELLHDFLFKRFVSAYTESRFLRGDSTLSMYLYKGIAARIHAYYTRKYNLYSYTRLTLNAEDGKLKGASDQMPYYLMPKKIYSRRFATDCFNGFFAEQALAAPTGIADVPEYITETASLPELQQQHSYFISDLTDIDWRGEKAKQLEVKACKPPPE